MSKEFSRHVQACEVCNSGNFEQVAPESPDNYRVLVCRTCGLLFASPTMSQTALQDFYDDEFAGDAGGGGAGAAGKAHKSFAVLARKARERYLPAIRRHIPDLNGVKALDLRSRNGALAGVLAAEGAIVLASDPMQPNVDACREAGLEAMQLSIADHYTMTDFGDERFDLVTGLTIHVLAHLPEPARFLHQARRVLKPGGYLFLDEKNVLAPKKNTSPDIYASGIGHFFHFTPSSLGNLLKSCGFEVVVLDEATARNSAFAHMMVVARRPEAPLGLQWQPEAVDLSDLKAAIDAASKTAAKAALKNRLQRKAKTFVRKAILRP